VRTVCLDAGRAIPRDEVFEAAPVPLPAVRVAALRRWAERPEIGQGTVNVAIWQNRELVHPGSPRTPRSAPPVVRRPAVATPGQGPTPVGRRAAAHGGVVYRLQNGELTAIGPDGLERFLATGIFRVFPTSRGLFAVGSGPTGAPELWVREMTGGRPWRLVSRFRYRTRVLDVVALPGRGGDWLCARGSREPGLLLITSEGLSRRVLWVRLEDGGLASVNARTARLRRVPKVRVSFATPFDMDSVTDDLVVVAGERFLRVRARDGSVEIVR
jgi:hypothetical protein